MPADGYLLKIFDAAKAYGKFLVSIIAFTDSLLNYYGNNSYFG